MFGLSATLTGAIIGLLFGLFSCFFLSPKLIEMVERQTNEPDQIMRKMRWVDPVFYPALGAFIGWYFF